MDAYKVFWSGPLTSHFPSPINIFSSPYHVFPFKNPLSSLSDICIFMGLKQSMNTVSPVASISLKEADSLPETNNHQFIVREV